MNYKKIQCGEVSVWFLFVIAYERFIPSFQKKYKRQSCELDLKEIDCVVISDSCVLNRGDILNRSVLVRLSCHNLGHSESHLSQQDIMRSVTLPLS